MHRQPLTRLLSPGRHALDTYAGLFADELDEVAALMSKNAVAAEERRLLVTGNAGPPAAVVSSSCICGLNADRTLARCLVQGQKGAADLASYRAGGGTRTPNPPLPHENQQEDLWHHALPCAEICIFALACALTWGNDRSNH